MAKEGVKKMLALSFAVALVIDIAFPLAVAFYLWRRLGVSWRFFLFGALIFAVFQLFTRVPAVAVLQSALGVTQWPAEAVWAWLFGLSLTAGLVEEIGRWVGYRWLFKPAERTWDNALMYGAGHGGLESILLVGLLGVLPSLINVLVFSQTPPDRLSVPPEAAAQIQQLLTLSWWLPLLGGFERIAAVIFHIGMSVVALQVLTNSRMVWLWLQWPCTPWSTSLRWGRTGSGGQLPARSSSGPSPCWPSGSSSACVQRYEPLREADELPDASCVIDYANHCAGDCGNMLSRPQFPDVFRGSRGRNGEQRTQSLP